MGFEGQKRKLRSARTWRIPSLDNQGLWALGLKIGHTTSFILLLPILRIKYTCRVISGHTLRALQFIDRATPET